MRVSQACRTRRSIRAFLDRPVPNETLRAALSEATWAPSGGNLQPWRVHVVSGAALARLRGVMVERLAAGGTDALEYAVYPAQLCEPYRTQRHRLGEAMYEALGIERADRSERLRRFEANYDFFGAPVGLFCYIDRRMGPPQWSDLGMYLQTLMLLLQESGIDSCAQESWSAYAETVSRFLAVDPTLMLFCGMAIGYADPDASVNAFERERAPLAEFARFHAE
jgi:nitroreductase